MTSYNQNLTEEIKTSAFLIKQTPSSFNILINGNDYTHKCIKLKIKNRLNEIPSAELEVIGLKPSNWDDISEGKVIKVIYGNTIIFKGIIQSIEPTSNYRAKIFALDSVCVKLSNWGLRNASIAGRYRKTATATSTIVNELCSENLDGASPFIVNVGTNTNYGSIDFRAENMTRLQALAKLAKLIGYDWWPSYPSDVDTFNIDTRKGSSTSVKTFYTYGTNQNCAAVKRLKDKSQLWNAVTVLGYGDGTNQVMSSEYTDATSISTWGRHEKVWTDKTLRTVSECNSLAQKILNDHKDPINKFTLKIHDVTEILPDLVEVGDQVTIYDNAIYLDTETHDYKVVAMEIYFGAGGSYITLECHSKTYAFLEDVMTLKQSLQTQEGTAIIKDPGHSHADGTYSAASHSHTDGTYAAAGHTHADGTYTAVSHTHADGTYTAVSHTHDEGDYVASHSHGVGTYGADAHGASDQGYYFGIYTNTISTTGSWVSVGTQINLGSYTYLFHGVWGFIRIDFDAGSGYSWSCAIKVRVKNTSDGTYYPNSSGLMLTAGFVMEGMNTIVFPFYIHIPHNWTSDSYVLQYYIENNSHWNTSGTQEIIYAYHGSRGHTHSISGSSGVTGAYLSGNSGSTAPDITGSSTATAPDVSGSSGSTAPDVSGSSGSTAPDVSGESSSNTTGITG